MRQASLLHYYGSKNVGMPRGSVGECGLLLLLLLLRMIAFSSYVLHTVKGETYLVVNNNQLCAITF